MAPESKPPRPMQQLPEGAEPSRNKPPEGRDHVEPYAKDDWGPTYANPQDALKLGNYRYIQESSATEYILINIPNFIRGQEIQTFSR